MPADRLGHCCARRNGVWQGCKHTTAWQGCKHPPAPCELRLSSLASPPSGLLCLSRGLHKRPTPPLPRPLVRRIRAPLMLVLSRAKGLKLPLPATQSSRHQYHTVVSIAPGSFKMESHDLQYSRSCLVWAWRVAAVVCCALVSTNFAMRPPRDDSSTESL